MDPKICWQCHSEVDVLATVCPKCNTPLGPADGGEVAHKPGRRLPVRVAVVLGFLLAIIAAMAGIYLSLQRNKATTPLNPTPPPTQVHPKLNRV